MGVIHVLIAIANHNHTNPIYRDVIRCGCTWHWHFIL